MFDTSYVVFLKKLFVFQDLMLKFQNP